MNATIPAADLCTAADLHFAHPGVPVFAGLSFAIPPGLTLLRGGDGRGKTTLLKLLAGVLAPQAGRLQRPASVFWAEPADAAFDDVVAQAWLAGRAREHAAWRAERVVPLAEAFGLAEHLPKPMYMLSTGSRRKVGLVAAAASGAALVLLDSPFAALDGPSRRLVTDLLAEAAHAPDRAWVVADYEAPALPPGARFTATIDLGD